MSIIEKAIGMIYNFQRVLSISVGYLIFFRFPSALSIAHLVLVPLDVVPGVVLEYVPLIFQVATAELRTLLFRRRHDLLENKLETI